MYRITLPARINILGNPSDANEGDFGTISAAVDVYAGALIKPADNVVLQRLCPTEAGFEIAQQLTFTADEIPQPYTGEFDLVKGAINRLYQFSEEFREKVAEHGVSIGTWTDVPRQSGLGGSSLFVLSTLAGLREIYNLDQRRHNDYVLGELTQRVESKELGITCGFADRYVPLLGGIAYVDYRGKLHHAPIDNEPYATYERLDPWVENLPLVAISTGIERDSGDVHGRMRPRYLEEHDAWVCNGGNAPPMVCFMRGAWETAWRGKIALLRGDLPSFGALMNENHKWVNEMMSYCGFKDGAGWANNRLIDVALENGAFGAKLTGAGGGGSVFALMPTGEEQKLMDIWRKTAQDEGLDNARVYRLNIAHHGLRIEEV